MPVPVRKPMLTLDWHIWAVVAAVILAIVLLLAVGVSY
jgi:hypothetical protein